MRQAVSSNRPFQSLRWIAMGLLMTILDAPVGGFDAVPDVAGWALVVWGVRALSSSLSRERLVPLAVLAGGISVVVLHPDLRDGMPESTGWLLSLPQVVFCLVLARELGRVTDFRARRSLVWLQVGFGASLIGPVLLYGGRLDGLLVPLALVTVVTNVVLVIVLFRLAGQHTARATGPKA